MKRALYCLLTMLFMCNPAFAQYRVFSKKDGFFSLRDKMYVYFFSADTHRLVVRDEGDIKRPQYGSLDKAMRKSPCVAGVNGGFFSADKKGTPLGLVIQDGKRITPLASGSFTVTGVVYQGAKGPVLARSAELKKNGPLPLMRAAVQGGPFLVERGSIVRGLDDRRASGRTFVATDGGKRWCIGITSSLTLKELGQWLTTPGAMGDFKVKAALNLDGGSSSAFWCHESGISYPSFKQVRNYLGVAPKN